MDLCDTIANLRSWIFAKDRDVVLQASRVFEGPGTFPIGGIAIWSGTIASIPTGFQLCNGTNGTPDLRDRFVISVGPSYVVGATGGAATQDLSHTHGPGTLTTDNDTHRHEYGAVGGNFYTSTAQLYYTDYDTHNHSVTGGLSDSQLSATSENRPPYYALAFIQRLT